MAAWDRCACGKALIGAACAAIGFALGASEASALAGRHAATGLVECGGALATGQLTGSADRITTAAHALYDEAGRPRARFGPCMFRVMVGGVLREFAIRPGAAIGSASPYHRAGSQDWAVARLAAPVPGVAPYRLGGAVRVGEEVVLVAARGRSDAPLASVVQSCRVIALERSARGGREVHTDCAGRTGDSGAAYLTRSGRLVAIHAGVRRAPGFGAGHAFGVAAEGAFRSAASR